MQLFKQELQRLTPSPPQVSHFTDNPLHTQAVETAAAAAAAAAELHQTTTNSTAPRCLTAGYRRKVNSKEVVEMAEMPCRRHHCPHQAG